MEEGEEEEEGGEGEGEGGAEEEGVKALMNWSRPSTLGEEGVT